MACPRLCKLLQDKYLQTSLQRYKATMFDQTYRDSIGWSLARMQREYEFMKKKSQVLQKLGKLEATPPLLGLVRRVRQ